MQIKCHETVKHNVSHGQSSQGDRGIYCLIWIYIYIYVSRNKIIKIKYKLQNSRKIQLTIK